MTKAAQSADPDDPLLKRQQKLGIETWHAKEAFRVETPSPNLNNNPAPAAHNPIGSRLEISAVSSVSASLTNSSDSPSAHQEFSDKDSSFSPIQAGIAELDSEPRLPVSSSIMTRDHAIAARAAPVALKPLILEQRAEVLRHFPTDTRINYKIRMYQFARAAIYILNQKISKISDPAEIAAIQAIIHKIKNNIEDFESLIDTKPEKSHSNSNIFFMLLADEIKDALKISYSKAQKQLLQAENLITWMDGRPSHTNTSHLGDFTIVRSETPVNALTLAQKTEYLSIRNAKPPLWFRKLSEQLKDYLRRKVPETLDGDWSTIEQSIPAALRLIPGLANLAESTIVITSTDGSSETHSSYRSATPVPLDIKDRNERIRITALNIEQYIELRINKALEEGNIASDSHTIEDKIRAVNALEQRRSARNFSIPVNSLLTEFWGESLGTNKDNNTDLVNAIRKAIQKLLVEKPYYKELDLFGTNTPTNNLRYLFLARHVTNHAEDLIYIQYCADSIEKLENSPQTPEETKRLALLRAAKKALVALQNSSDYFGDQAFMRAALYQIINPNSLYACKSGKDRAGALGIFITAMLAYYLKHKEFPGLDSPKKLGTLLTALAYGGVSLAIGAAGLALAIPLGFMAAGFIPITILIGLAAGGATIALLIAIKRSVDLFQHQPQLTKRQDFVSLLRHIMLTGFSAESASMNAPGATGLKNPGLIPDDLSTLAQRRSPFDPSSLAGFVFYAVLIIVVIVVAHSVLVTYLFSAGIIAGSIATLLNIAIPSLLIAPLVTYFVVKSLQYYSTSKLRAKKGEITKQAEIEARANFKKGLKVDEKLAGLNKLKGNKTPIKHKILLGLACAAMLAAAGGSFGFFALPLIALISPLYFGLALSAAVIIPSALIITSYTIHRKRTQHSKIQKLKTQLETIRSKKSHTAELERAAHSPSITDAEVHALGRSATVGKMASPAKRSAAAAHSAVGFLPQPPLTHTGTRSASSEDASALVEEEEQGEEGVGVSSGTPNESHR